MYLFEMLEIKVAFDRYFLKHNGFSEGNLRFNFGELFLVLDTKLIDKAGRAFVTVSRGGIQTIRHMLPFLR